MFQPNPFIHDAKKNAPGYLHQIVRTDVTDDGVGKWRVFFDPTFEQFCSNDEVDSNCFVRKDKWPLDKVTLYAPMVEVGDNVEVSASAVLNITFHAG